MNYRIIADSSCDLSEELKEKLNIQIVPLTLQLNDKIYIDDESLDIKQYLNDMKHCKTAPKTACPSPEDFLNSFKGDEYIFGITLSSELSGTYNSAMLASRTYLEEHEKKKIHIFNSRSASVGETLIALKIKELADKGNSFEEIVERVEKYISEMKTFFLIESLDHLAKAGRLNSLVAMIASLLAIKPIMGSTPNGTIRLVHKVRGYKKAFEKLIETIGEEGANLESKTIAISHSNCPDRALILKEEIAKRYNFKEIVLVEMRGLSSTYADDGGLIIAF